VSDGPFGPESHLMRADVDQYLFRAAQKYGATAFEGSRVTRLDIQSDGVEMEVATPDGVRMLKADYVIDASGRQSLLADRLGLREEPCRFKTNSRTLFTHMTGVRPYDEVDPETLQPTPWHEGTLHHLFDGGWVWVIPFNNHPGSSTDSVSVGLTLDNVRHPKVSGETPEDEWSRFLASQPSIAAQFRDAQLVFPWISTARTQFSSSRTVGDRWILMSHAAGAIDALFSRGMSNTMAVIEAFVPTFLSARLEKDYRAERFAYVDTLSQTILDNNDKLVAGSYIAFRHFDLWRAWSKMWFLAWNLGVIRVAGSYYRYIETGDEAIFDELHRGELPGTFAPEAPSAQAQFDACYELMEKVESGARTVDSIIPEMADILGDGEASPAPLNLHDVLRQWHDGSEANQKLLYDWGRTASPLGMRKWFQYDRATIERAAELVKTA
jgi:tetracycline 7-halogenase / FADH2 O2-dependent halogenase